MRQVIQCIEEETKEAEDVEKKRWLEGCGGECNKLTETKDEDGGTKLFEGDEYYFLFGGNSEW